MRNINAPALVLATLLVSLAAPSSWAQESSGMQTGLSGSGLGTGFAQTLRSFAPLGSNLEEGWGSLQSGTEVGSFGYGTIGSGELGISAPLGHRSGLTLNGTTTGVTREGGDINSSGVSAPGTGLNTIGASTNSGLDANDLSASSASKMFRYIEQPGTGMQSLSFPTGSPNFGGVNLPEF